MLNPEFNWFCGVLCMFWGVCTCKCVNIVLGSYYTMFLYMFILYLSSCMPMSVFLWLPFGEINTNNIFAFVSSSSCSERER